LIHGRFFQRSYDICRQKKTLQSKEITFDNIWGVLDEDMYHKAINNAMNQETKTGQPFLTTIS
jgi:hypothetical protein